MDDEHCYRVACSRDGRFDGAFVVAVRSTGIYCRPSCPSRTPKRENMSFYPTPAAAQEAGFRACKRCRPDAAPGSPEWDARGDVVARAVRLIGDGVVEREGVGGLAGRLGYSPRHLHRLLCTELGTGPLRLALAHRVQHARALLENTTMPVTDVAWASGFGSIRQFNARMRETYALSPREIRESAPRSAAGSGSGSDVIRAHLPYRPPLDLAGVLAFLAKRAVPGVEAYDGSTYSRVLRLPRGFGIVRIDGPSVLPKADRARAGRAQTSRPTVECSFELDDVRDYAVAVSRVRRMLDLDADPGAIGASLAGDPVLGPLVAAYPGARVPGTPDPEELAVRALLGQQISLAAARALAGWLTVQFGDPLAHPRGPLTHAFPAPGAIAAAPGDHDWRMPASRGRALRSLAGALADGSVSLDPGTDRDEADRALRALPGIGPWTAAYIRMRGLGDPDVYLEGDHALRLVLAEATAGAEPGQWKPWRSYAVVHLWSTLADTTPADPTPADPTPATGGTTT